MKLPTDLLVAVACALPLEDALNLACCCRTMRGLAKSIFRTRQIECAHVWGTPPPPEVLRGALTFVGVPLSAMVDPQLLVDASAANLAVLREWGLTLEQVRADENEVLRAAAARGHVEVLRALWAWGLTLEDVRTRNGEALYHAVVNCSCGLFRSGGCKPKACLNTGVSR